MSVVTILFDLGKNQPARMVVDNPMTVEKSTVDRLGQSCWIPIAFGAGVPSAEALMFAAFRCVFNDRDTNDCQTIHLSALVAQDEHGVRISVPRGMIDMASKPGVR